MNHKGWIIKTIHSDILKEKREIWIYHQGDSLSEKYPVVFVLDAESHFSTIVDMVKLFSDSENKGYLPNLTIIGIPNTNRVRDFTPSNDPNPSASSSMPVKNKEFAMSGGAENFTLFLENELIPWLNASYSISQNRIIIGHSMSGLMVETILLRHTGLFTGYIAIDPSNWWNHEEIIKMANNRLSNDKSIPASFIYANSNEAKEYAKYIKDSATRNPYQSQLKFGGSFLKNSNRLLSFNWIHYERESHFSIPTIAIYDGLQILIGLHHKLYPDEFNHQIYGKSQIFNKNMIDSSKLLMFSYQELDNISFNSGNYYKVPDSYFLYDDSIHSSSNLCQIMSNIFYQKNDFAKAREYDKKAGQLKK